MCISGAEPPSAILSQAKSRKYRGVFKLKSRVNTWQVRGIWSQQLEYKQVLKRGTEPDVWKDNYKRSLLARHNSCKCAMPMETTHNFCEGQIRYQEMKLVEV